MLNAHKTHLRTAEGFNTTSTIKKLIWIVNTQKFITLAHTSAQSIVLSLVYNRPNSKLCIIRVSLSEPRTSQLNSGGHLFIYLSMCIYRNGSGGNSIIRSK